MKRWIQVCCLLAGLLSGVVARAAEEPNVPQGINYKRVDEATNQKAVAALEKALSSEAEMLKLLNATPSVTCGPGYWGAIRQEMLDKKIPVASARMISFGDTTNDQKPMDGAMFAEPAAKTAFAAHLVQDIGPKPKIRKLNEQELFHYWAMVPFDIDEPIFILEAGSKAYLFDLTAQADKLSVLWIDELSGYQKPKSP